jgi:hypothetical protein
MQDRTGQAFTACRQLATAIQVSVFSAFFDRTIKSVQSRVTEKICSVTGWETCSVGCQVMPVPCQWPRVVRALHIMDEHHSMPRAL